MGLIRFPVEMRDKLTTSIDGNAVVCTQETYIRECV